MPPRWNFGQDFQNFLFYFLYLTEKKQNLYSGGSYLVVKDLQKQKTRKTLALRVHLSLCHSFTRQNGLRGLTRRSSYPNLYESSVLKLSFLNFLSPYNESIPIICSLYYTKNPAKSRSIFNYF